MVGLGLLQPPPVQRMCWGLQEVTGEVTGVAALKCITGNVCQHLVRAVGAVLMRCERKIRGVSLSVGGGLDAASRSKEL